MGKSIIELFQNQKLSFTDNGKVETAQAHFAIRNSKDIDNEAKRIVRSMPKWLPGEGKGKKVRTRCRLPINFQLG